MRLSTLALAAAVTFGLASPDALALALGRVTVQSALGEPLRAEIDVPEITPEEVNSLKAAIASPAQFRSAGLEYSPALANAQITLQRRPNGSYFLRLASDRAVNEPFMDVILEANWASGRVQRDFTLLFDPPTTARQQPTTPLAPQAAPPAVAGRTPPPAGRGTPAPGRGTQAPSTAAPSSAARPAPAPGTARAPAAAPAGEAGEAGQRVTVRSGDTAGKLAAANKPASISLDQMLVAMLRANPDAFVDGNVNRLRSGAVLQMPSGQQAAAVPQGEAHQALVAQSRDFNEFRRRLAEGVPAAAAPAAGRETSGRVQAEVEDKKAAAPSGDRLTLSKGGVQPKSAGSADKIARERAAREQSERVAELNKNIAELNQLKGGTPGAAGTGTGARPGPGVTAPPGVPAPPTRGAASAPAPAAATAPGAKTPAATAPAATAPAATAPAARPSAPAATANPPAAATAPAAASAARPGAPATPAPATTAAATATPPATGVAPASPGAAPATPGAPAPTAAASGAAAPAAVAPVPAASTAAAPAASAAAPVGSAPVAAAPAKPPVARRTPPPPPPEPSLLDDLLENPLIPALGVGLLAVLAGFGFYKMRQKRKTAAVDSSFLESRLQPDSFFGASGGQRIDTAEANNPTGSSMVYSPSQLDAAGDVDPVAEADVYLAYGRDLQAEEILKEALRINPQRVAIHSKLLEIYAKRRDAKAFEAVAAEAYNLTQGNGPEWEHICDLGRELDAGNPLYRPGGQPGAGAAAAAAAAAVTANQFGSTQPSAVQEPASVPADVDLDLDFSLGDEPDTIQPPLPATPVMPPAGRPEPLASQPMPVEPVPLNTSVSAPQPTIDMLGEPEAEAPSLHLDDHGLDFTPPEPTPAAAAPSPVAPAPAAAAPADDGMLEFDLGGLSLDLPGSSPAPATPATPAASAPAPAAPPAHDIDLAPLAFDLDTAPAPAAPAVAATAGDGIDDPLATKLALAEEFNAIGDADGARSLAEEVLAEASGDLKSRAQRLLAEIG